MKPPAMRLGEEILGSKSPPLALLRDGATDSQDNVPICLSIYVSFQWYTPAACLQLKEHFHGQVNAACQRRNTGTVG